MLSRRLFSSPLNCFLRAHLRRLRAAERARCVYGEVEQTPYVLQTVGWSRYGLNSQTSQPHFCWHLTNWQKPTRLFTFSTLSAACPVELRRIRGFSGEKEYCICISYYTLTYVYLWLMSANILSAEHPEIAGSRLVVVSDTSDLSLIRLRCGAVSFLGFPPVSVIWRVSHNTFW